MSADPAIVSAISNILKTRYIGPIQDQFPKDRVLEEILNHNREDVDGDKAVIPIRLAGNPAIGYRADYGDLPAVGRQKTEKVNVTMSYLYGRGSFSGPALAASRTNAGAFARVMDDETKNLIEDMRVVANAFNYGDGSGAIARITVISSLTLTVDRWSRLFTVGRVLDSYADKATATAISMNSQTITAVNRNNLTITLGAVTSATVGDYLFIEDTKDVCQMGLLGIADDGTFLTTHQGLSRSSYSQWCGKVMKSSTGNARTLSEALLTDALGLLEEEGIMPDLAIGTIFQRNDLLKEFQAKTRFVNPDKKIKAGIRGIEIADNLVFTWDADVPPGYCFLGDTQYLEFYEMGPLSWMDKDGSLLARISSKDAYEFTAYLYRELGSSRNNAWCRIEDLNDNRPTTA